MNIASMGAFVTLVAGEHCDGDARGEPNGHGDDTFGLKFDPAKLICASCTPGADIAGGTVTANVSQKDNGQLGFVIDAALGTAHGGGTRTLATVTYTVAAGVAGDEVIPLTFVDQPNARSILPLYANLTGTGLD